jgi:hypothetical protein
MGHVRLPAGSDLNSVTQGESGLGGKIWLGRQELCHDAESPVHGPLVPGAVEPP